MKKTKTKNVKKRVQPKKGAKTTKKKKAVEKATKRSRPGNNTRLRKDNSKGKSRVKLDAKVSNKNKRLPVKGRKTVKVVTVQFGKEWLTSGQARNKSNPELLRKARRLFSGVDNSFTKEDLIFNLYGKESQTVSKVRQKTTSGKQVKISKSKKTHKGKRFKKQRRTKVNPLQAVKIQDELGSFTNSLELILTEKTFEGKLQQVREHNFPDVDFYRNKETLLPRAFMIILKTVKNGKEFERSNKLSAPGMAVTKENIKQEILVFMIQYQDDYIEKIEELSELMDGDEDSINESSWVYDPKNIRSVYIRFFYASNN